MQGRVKEALGHVFAEVSGKAALSFGVPHEKLPTWTRLAMFLELRKRGLGVAAAAEELGLSKPTGWRLAREARKDLFGDEAEHTLPFRIAYALRPRPLSARKIYQIFPDVECEQIDEALAELVSQKRVSVSQLGTTATYSVLHAEDRMVGQAWASRIGALRSLLDHVLNTVEARFLREDTMAFARTIDFRISERDNVKLQTFYEQQLWPFLASLERDALANEGEQDEKQNGASPSEVRLSILWSSVPPKLDTKEEGKRT